MVLTCTGNPATIEAVKVKACAGICARQSIQRVFPVRYINSISGKRRFFAYLRGEKYARRAVKAGFRFVLCAYVMAMRQPSHF